VYRSSPAPSPLRRVSALGVCAGSGRRAGAPRSPPRSAAPSTWTGARPPGVPVPFC